MQINDKKQGVKLTPFSILVLISMELYIIIFIDKK